MKLLVIAIIVFAQQPAKAPPNKGVAEANRAESTRYTKGTQNNQTPPAQPTPSAPQTPIVPESQRNAETANSHTQQGNKQTPSEDSSTQGKLTWFTGVLAAVGVLQLVVMFLTWLVYRRQAHEMRRQRHEMRRQRHVMLRQWKAMGEQAGLMKSQASETEKQTRHLEGSVAAAKTSADAAKLSGDIAARVSIPTLVIDKFETGDTGSANLEAMLQYPKVKVVIKNYGQTPAFLRSWTIVFFCGDLPPLPEYKGHRASGIVLERDVVQPNVLYTLPEIYSWHRQEISLTDVRAIISREKHLWAYGFISYYDLFGTRRRFKFCEYALNVSEGWIQWVGGFSPEAYTGTDDFPFGQAAGTEEKAENPNLDTTCN